jgi:two-component system sensor histidine kinase/response regulator
MTLTSVLVVEDEVVVALDLKQQLARLGYTVPAVATTGEEALRLVAETKPDVVLMDIRLAVEMDGLETAVQVRTQFVTPVIFLAAHADKGAPDWAKHTQPLGYLLKPLVEADLKTTIEGALGRNQLEQQEYASTQHLQQEIEARKQTEATLTRERDQLRHYVVELEARHKELDALAHIVAHDLKNPLGVILGFAGLLAEDYATLTEKQLREGIDVIAKSGERMNRIIDDLHLLVSVPDTDVEQQSLDMTTIVAGALQRVNSEIVKSQAEIVLPMTWPLATGYAVWVEEVWVNLLYHAIAHGGQPPCVTLGAGPQSNGMVRFWLRDNGPGLSPEEQARLFSPSAQRRHGRTSGQFLGLAVAQCIVEKLGGQVGVEGQVEQGNTLFFTLPAATD